MPQDEERVGGGDVPVGREPHMPTGPGLEGTEQFRACFVHWSNALILIVSSSEKPVGTEDSCSQFSSLLVSHPLSALLREHPCPGRMALLGRGWEDRVMGG